MKLTYFLKLYLLTVPVFFVIDLVWLGLVAKNFYAKHLGYLMRPNPIWAAAILFYLLNIIGIILLAVLPGLEKNNFVKTIILGVLYGLFTYATYDLTNYATIKDWPLIVVVVDIIWGVVLSASVAAISFLIAKRLG